LLKNYDYELPTIKVNYQRDTTVKTKPDYFCWHCRFITGKCIFKTPHYTVIGFPEPYTLSLIPHDHRMNDYDILTLVEYTVDYIKSLSGFHNIRLLINRNCKNNKQKEHIHIRLIFDNDKEQFNKIFNSYADDVYKNDGILDLKLYNIIQSNVPSGDINSQMPYPDDACVTLNKNDIDLLFFNKSIFIEQLNSYYYENMKGNFNLKTSPLYVFFWIEQNESTINFIKSVISFGTRV